jgi:tRNA dimethylallyltransferase
LRARVETRFKAMLNDGAVEEAAALEGIDSALPAAKTLGLRELWALRRGEITEAQAMETAVTATRQFAKRQTTWFRNRMADWHRLDAIETAGIVSQMRSLIA